MMMGFVDDTTGTCNNFCPQQQISMLEIVGCKTSLISIKVLSIHPGIREGFQFFLHGFFYVDLSFFYTIRTGLRYKLEAAECARERYKKVTTRMQNEKVGADAEKME